LHKLCKICINDSTFQALAHSLLVPSLVEKLQTLVIVPLSQKLTSEALKYGTHCKSFHSFTCTPTSLSMNGIQMMPQPSQPNWSVMRQHHQLQSVAETSCRGQESTMWDVVWISAQRQWHRSFLLTGATAALCSPKLVYQRSLLLLYGTCTMGKTSLIPLHPCCMGIRTHIYVNSLHPEQDLDMFSHFCTPQPHDWATDIRCCSTVGRLKQATLSTLCIQHSPKSSYSIYWPGLLQDQQWGFQHETDQEQKTSDRRQCFDWHRQQPRDHTRTDNYCSLPTS